MDMICSIVPEADEFSHEVAMSVYRQALQEAGTKQVVIDLHYATEATTSGFARLVLLRKTLRAEGRDLVLANLRDRVALLYQINRLDDVLPKLTQLN